MARLYIISLLILLIISCTVVQWTDINIVQDTNQYRSTVNQPTLEVDARLQKVAQIRADYLAQTEVLSHDAPCNAFCLMSQYDIPPIWAGENIGWNNWPDWTSSEPQMMQAWISSPEHNANIADCHYTKIGVGVAESADGKRWYTQEFWGDRSC